MNDPRNLLAETLAIKSITVEEATKFFPSPGVTSRQIRRWIAKESYPQKRQQRLIKEAIAKMQKELPDMIDDSDLIPKKVGDYTIYVKPKAGWTGLPIPEEKIINQKFRDFFDEMMKKADPMLRQTLTQKGYFEGFREWLFASRKLGVRLPKV